MDDELLDALEKLANGEGLAPPQPSPKEEPCDLTPYQLNRFYRRLKEVKGTALALPFQAGLPR